MESLQELHESKGRELLYSQRLARVNGGFNFATPIAEKLEQQYKIHISVEQKQTFKGVSVKWNYDLDFPMEVSYQFRWGDGSPTKLLQHIMWYCKTPRYTLLKDNNRKDKLSWSFPKLRQVEVHYEEIDIKVSALARELMLLDGVKDFEADLKHALTFQREANTNEIRLLEEYIALKEDEKTLKLLSKGDDNYYYNRPKLSSFKITKKQAEKSSSVIEKALAKIESELSFLSDKSSSIVADDDEALDNDEDTEYCDDCGNSLDECQC